MSINILFLGGAKRVSVAEAFIEEGIHLNEKILIFSYELSKYEPISCIGKIINGRKWNDPGILDHLAKIIQENEINIVLPFVDIGTILCSKLRSRLPKTFFCIASEYLNEIFFDKRKSQEWFIENKLLIPPFEMEVPLIAKLITGSGAKGIKYFYNQTQLESFLNENDISDYFFQQIIEGMEFSVDCYVDKGGEVISIVPRQRLEVMNGEATKCKTVKDIEVINISKDILCIGQIKGPVTIQFIREKDTKLLYLIEINPRFGSGILTSIKAGANTCQFILKDYLGIRNEPLQNWKEDLIMTRAFREFYFYATDN